MEFFRYCGDTSTCSTGTQERLYMDETLQFTNTYVQSEKTSFGHRTELSHKCHMTAWRDDEMTSLHVGATCHTDKEEHFSKCARSRNGVPTAIAFCL